MDDDFRELIFKKIKDHHYKQENKHQIRRILKSKLLLLWLIHVFLEQDQLHVNWQNGQFNIFKKCKQIKLDQL